MGLLDKLKSVVNAVTGGGARVTLEYDPIGFPGEPLRVRVTATSTGGEIKSQGVFIDVLGTEQITVSGQAVVQSQTQPGAGQPGAGQPAGFGQTTAGWQSSAQPQYQQAMSQGAPAAPGTVPHAGQPAAAQAGQAGQSDINISHTMYTQSVQIGPPLTLAPHETHQAEGTITLPLQSQPTYAGRHCTHQWLIRGRLEAWGNDPDSGYQPLRVGIK